MAHLHVQEYVPWGYHVVEDDAVDSFPGLCWDCGEAAEPHEALCAHCLYEAANADFDSPIGEDEDDLYLEAALEG